MINVNDMTDEELELTRESLCEGCKGNLFGWESDCYLRCKDFREVAAETRAEMEEVKK